MLLGVVVPHLGSHSSSGIWLVKKLHLVLGTASNSSGYFERIRAMQQGYRGSSIRPVHRRNESNENEAGTSRFPPGFAWSAKGRICIVTTEFHGLFKNGGIGTANTGLALALAEAGCAVTVLFANLPVPPDPELRQLQERYHNIGIELEVLVETPAIRQPLSNARSASYAVYLYLREREFDVVYFHDNCGYGFYSLLAKNTGCFHDPSLLLVVAHGPNEWVYELNSPHYYDKASIIRGYLERRSVELADALISPSQYLVDWMTARGWKLPTHVFVQQNIVRVTAPPSSQSEEKTPLAVKEIVFFGRHEVRKGFTLFCDAIDLLKDRVDLDGLQITFLGKFSEINGMHSGIYLVERSAKWKTSIRMLVKLDQDEALRYLSRDGTLAVIPSLAENSPCVVVECLQLGIPFVATSSGGTAELIDPADVGHCLVPPDPKALAERLADAVKNGHSRATLSISQTETQRRWRSFHGIGDDLTDPVSAAAWRAAPTCVVGQDTRPLVSICLAISNEFVGLEHILGAILEQSYQNYEVIIIGANGTDPDAMHGVRGAVERRAREVPVRFISEGHLEAAPARNLAAAQARGQFLLFLDETNVILMHDSLDVLVTAAIRTGANIVTGFPLKFEHDVKPREGRDGELYIFPVGACVEIGIIENCFGDALALVEREAFDKIGGFTPLVENQAVYWHFFATAALSGLSLEIVPRPIFWHRWRNSFERGSTRLYRPILDVYGSIQLKSVRYLFERFINAAAENKVRLERLLGNVAPAKRALVLRVSSWEPNSKEGIEGFLRYNIESGRVRDAREFARYNDSASELERATLASTGPGPRLSSAVGGGLATAEAARLDGTKMGKAYRHLDISVLGVMFGDEIWQTVKFKLCLTQKRRLLEFRELLNGPVVFTEFPGTERDAYGPVWRFSIQDIPAVSGWKSERDKLLLRSVVALLPKVVEAAVDDASELSAEERQVWREEAAGLSAAYLRAMRDIGIFGRPPEGGAHGDDHRHT